MWRNIVAGGACTCLVLCSAVAGSAAERASLRTAVVTVTLTAGGQVLADTDVRLQRGDIDRFARLLESGYARARQSSSGCLAKPNAVAHAGELTITLGEQILFKSELTITASAEASVLRKAFAQTVDAIRQKASSGADATPRFLMVNAPGPGSCNIIDCLESGRGDAYCCYRYCVCDSGESFWCLIVCGL